MRTRSAWQCGVTSLLVFFTLLCGAHQGSAGQSKGADSGIPLEQMLNVDGTLRPAPGVSGTIDPAGWKMQLLRDGRPQFIHPSSPASINADTADVHWDSRFVGPSGVDGFIYAIAMIGTDIYFAGSFYSTDHIVAPGIVRWNSGTGSWSALGSGVDGPVNALAVRGTDLYVGGGFSHAGGIAARYIAKWNGSSWSSLGVSPNDGVNGPVRALAVSGSNLFVGGDFTQAGSGTTVNNIARWDGSGWNSLGTGMNNFVSALAIMGSDLYAGGDFTSAGGTNVRYIARWTGSAWVPLGASPNDGVNSLVTSLAPAPPYLYVGGLFSEAGQSLTANGIARWNGTTWSALGNGFNNLVNTVVTNGRFVYAGGYFTATGINNVERVAVWDTLSSAWSALNQGVDSTVYALLLAGSDLYAGGEFMSYNNGSSTGPVNRIAKWTSGAWQSLGTANSNSINGTDILALAFSGTDLYVGGIFTNAGGTPANRIARYNLASNTWSSLGGGLNDLVDAIAVAPSGTIYVGGYFTAAGGNTANYIARWNGSTWSTLGTAPNDGTDGPVYTIAVSGTDVYVGGSFSKAGSTTARNIARWNGTSWSSLGAGLNSQVASLGFKGSDLYAGGFFDTAGGIRVNNIARWNGTSWSPLGTPPNDGVLGSVFTLTVIGPKLYVGGSFIAAGGTVPAVGVASWDGSVWSALGNGLSAEVYGLAASGGSLVATGYFTTSGILNVNGIAVWDTGSAGPWKALGSGLAGGGEALAAAGNDIMVGGSFSQAGAKPSFRLARWNSTMTATGVDHPREIPREFVLEQNYPNPFNPATTISFSLSVGSVVSLKVYDILGREVRTLVHRFEEAGSHAVTFDATGLASGVYLYQLSAGSFVAAKKLLLIR